MKLVFYNDTVKLMLLIGIGSIGTDSDSDQPSPRVDEEKFFVTIQIDETFLRWLDDPVFIEQVDVIEKVT